MKFCSLLFLLVSFAGCATTDPMTKSGEWHPSGANDVNLAAMIANPADLSRGVGTSPVDGVQAANAITRLRTDNIKPLPDSGLAEIRLQSGGVNAAAPVAGSQ